jgi:hypothetical protein
MSWHDILARFADTTLWFQAGPRYFSIPAEYVNGTRTDQRHPLRVQRKAPLNCSVEELQLGLPKDCRPLIESIQEAI